MVVITVCVLPGSGDPASNYVPLLTAIQAKGYNVEFVPINFNATSIRGWRQQLREALAGHDLAQTVLAGFSWNAMTVFAEAAVLPVMAAWTISMPAFFAEDMEKQAQADLDYWGPRRIAAAAQISFAEYAARIACPVLAFAGSEEMWLTQHRALEVERLVLNGRAIIVPDVTHAINQPALVAAIQAVI